ncbi:MAG: PQQ-binding-like beta-propeller repeat protein, partial [Planctomycetales bacterium]
AGKKDNNVGNKNEDSNPAIRTVVAVAGNHTDLGGLHVRTLDLATGRPKAYRMLAADLPPALGNNLTVASASGNTFWVVSPPGGSYGAGGAYHLDLELTDVPEAEGSSGPAMIFDRQGSRVRFRTDRGRGGSTHGWKGAMRAGGFHRLQGHRLAVAGDVGFGLNDPGSRTRTVLWATGKGKDVQPLWSLSAADLKSPPSLGALVAAGDRLYVGGGSRDGSSGVVLVLDRESGTVQQTIDLPARVAECGLSVAGSRLYVSCEDGSLRCFD